MGLKYKVKSLIDAGLEQEVDVIGHQCNCFNTMGAGIAPLIAAAFPNAQRVDSATISGDREKLGKFTQARGGELAPQLVVVNFYGQYYYGAEGNNTYYDALRQSFKAFTMSVLDIVLGAEDPHIMGLPKLGAGLGGGDWSIISSIIEEEFSLFEVIIYVLDEKEIPEGAEVI